MDDVEHEEQRRKYQALADEKGREVWWRGEMIVPANPKKSYGRIKYGQPCPFCGVKQEYDDNRRCFKCRRDFVTDSLPPIRIPRDGQREYKVITQRDEFFGGKFDPMLLQELINRHAEEGWRVVSIATADVSTFFGTFWAGHGARQEIIVFLERLVELRE
jgi:hypothetical protein